MKRTRHHIERLKIRVPDTVAVDGRSLVRSVRKAVTPPPGVRMAKQTTLHVVPREGEDVHVAIARVLRDRLWGVR